MTKLAIQGRLVLLNHDLPRPVRYGEIEELTRQGHIQQSVELPNLITDAGLDAIVACFGAGWGGPVVGGNAYSPSTIIDNAADPVTGAFLAEMRVGALPLPSAPAVGDTDLAGDILQAWRVDDATLTTDYPATGQISVSAVIPPGDHDGVELTEEGLFNADGVLLARRIIDPPWEKPVGLSTQIIHLISIARV